MLQKLSIRNYALIDKLDIEFDKGLTIITGETGAGKSIILGALSLILGERADSKYFFNQDKKCIIEGLFNVKGLQLDSLFSDYDIDYETETIIRREISSDGKSRAFINDSPVNLQTLKAITEKLIDIHSQHAMLELNDEDFQLLIVDSLANHRLDLSTYKHDYSAYKKALVKLNELVTEQTRFSQELDYHQFLFSELENAALKPDETETLELSLTQLNNAELIKSTLLEANQLLIESDSSAISSMQLAISRLRQIESFNPDIAILNERVFSASLEIKDIAAELETIGQKTIYDNEKLQVVQDRLDIIYQLQQKHRVKTNGELLAIQLDLSDKLLHFNNSNTALEELAASIEIQRQSLIKMAQKISLARTSVFSKVSGQLVRSLQNLGMPSARIEIANSVSDAANFGPRGLDKINFLFSGNLGQNPAPLNKIASGGELSRFMLAVKSLISEHSALPSIIFDEIDTGISGETALKVGEVMQEMAKKMQVVTISHLPQIAAKGNTHYLVFKEEGATQTTTSIKKLQKDERVQVIAEMLSGKNPVAAAIDNAKALLLVSG